MATSISFDPGLHAALQAAVTEADRRGHDVVTMEHLMLKLVREPVAEAILVGCGVDVGALERELDEYLDLLTEKRGAPIPDETYIRILQRAAATVVAGGRSVVGVADAFASLAREPGSYSTMLLGAEGIERIDLLRQISHGKKDVRPAAPAGARTLALRFHNDDYTTMEEVLHLLQQLVGLDGPTAHAKMLEVHQRGSAIVATLPAAEAAEMAAELYAAADEAKAPLRVTLEPA